MPSSVIELEVNGELREFLVAPGTTLLSALRESLGLTAAKRGCAQGTCGTCTCLLDGQAVMSCLIPVETVSGGSVKTLEGVTNPDGSLAPTQQAFLDGFATQCGFCTPGMIMAAEALLAENPDPTREDVVRAISGNVCRCTGYESIINAILDAAGRRCRSSAPPSSAWTRSATSPAAPSSSRTSTRPACCICGWPGPSATTRGSRSTSRRPRRCRAS
jgi:carbon-monoxide dehydrogenase small subunit